MSLLLALEPGTAGLGRGQDVPLEVHPLRHGLHDDVRTVGDLGDVGEGRDPGTARVRLLSRHAAALDRLVPQAVQGPLRGLGPAGGLELLHLAGELGAPLGHRDLEVLLRRLALGLGLLEDPLRLGLGGLDDLGGLGARVRERLLVLDLERFALFLRLRQQRLVLAAHLGGLLLGDRHHLGGLGLGQRPDLGGLVRRQPQHAGDAVGHAFGGGRRHREAVDLLTELVDLVPRVLQLRGKVTGLRRSGIAVGGRDPQFGIEAVEVVTHLVLCITLPHNGEGQCDEAIAIGLR